jgi:hypothetical protein
VRRSLPLCILAAIGLLGNVPTVLGFTGNDRLTLTVPITCAHTVGSTLTEKPIRADEFYGVFNQPSIALRMEALRRAALYLPATEKTRLWTYLTQRRNKNVNDPNLYFDVGYADITLHLNKTGLFFLRKASERLNNPFAHLAYAIAQTDVDLLLEGGTPSTPSIRKLDAVYKLTDAINLNATKRQAGLWPTFIRIQQKLATLPAYQDFSLRDYSDTLVPYGGRYHTQPSSTIASCMVKPAASAKPITTHNASLNPQLPDPTLPLFSLAVTLSTSQPTPQCLDFYPVTSTDPGKIAHYEVKVRQGSQLLAAFQSHVGVGIIEDLNNDGQYELVLRQYKIDPLHPVLVYRYLGNQLTLDSAIQQLFE